ncbi:hypothetical protein FOA43_003528 [Brettanomyces nanus]|uniref:Uncharacterized protein n=1 Tax=Eeniella nana TaxID=13502 RepID=A0A875S8B0_EENNA|nr:uncharacterized protein FOA43_003528 [Brettanomyces nanus]QPG76142.1 hypothetical protein FOA43_003528 [Brettanomyces nanus]
MSDMKHGSNRGGRRHIQRNAWSDRVGSGKQIIVYGGAEGSDLDAKLARRKARFAKEDTQFQRDKEKNFGLTSRGEDLRLQTDENARTKLYENTIKRSRQFIREGGEGRNRDDILMNFRKLRESILRLGATESSKKILLGSMRFSAWIGHYQSYIPTINELLDNQHLDSTFLDHKELEEAWSYLCLHVVHFGMEYEKGFRIFFDHVKGNETVYRLLVSYTTKDYYTWMKIYSLLSKEKKDWQKINYFKILQSAAYDVVLKSVIKQLQCSYFVLDRKLIEEFTGLQYEILVKRFDLNWTLDLVSSLVKLRERGSREKGDIAQIN